MHQPALAQLLDLLVHEPVPLVPGDIAAELMPRIEANLPPPKLTRPRIGKVQQSIADPAAPQFGSNRNAPDQQILGPRLTSVVEQATGRRVLTFQSQILYGPTRTFELFVLDQG